ncbi:hypothetical protein DSECCO2_510530 [anaerobic digester metagenome]
MADDLDGVLVGAHRAVGAHAPELSAGLTGWGGVDLCSGRQGGKCHVVHNANGKVILWGILFQVLVHRQDLAGGGVLGAEAIATAYDLHGNALFLVNGADILIQRLAGGAGLLGAV